MNQKVKYHFTISTISFCLIFFGLLNTGCKIYSFTGASIPPNIKTITIKSFTNQSENANAVVSIELTDLLKDKFISETNLNLMDFGGDMEFSGVVTGYSIRGQASTADQTTAINRLTIAVKVDCRNNLNEKENWTQTFTRYDDFDSDLNLAEVEPQLVRSINQQIAEDIFNKAFVNW